MSSKRLIRAGIVLAILCVSVLLRPVAASANVNDVWIVGQGSGMCIDVPNGTTDNVTINIYTCRFPIQNNQSWNFEDVSGGYQIRNLQTNKCLAVLNASTAQNAAVIQYTCNQTSNSLWRSVAAGSANGYDYYEIQNVHSNKCLTVKNAGTANNTPLLQFTCNGGSNAKWTWY
jgi:hypothetical protein